MKTKLNKDGVAGIDNRRRYFMERIVLSGEKG